MDAAMMWSLVAADDDATKSAADLRADHENRAMGFVMGLLSLPFDLVVDVALLPADLIGWACGLEKSGRC